MSGNIFDSASRTVISRKENNQIDAKCIQSNGKACTLYSSSVLDNNTHYSFRFVFHQEATKGSPKFNIGLINEEYKDNNIGYIGCKYSEHN